MKKEIYHQIHQKLRLKTFFYELLCINGSKLAGRALFGHWTAILAIATLLFRNELWSFGKGSSESLGDNVTRSFSDITVVRTSASK